MSRFLSSLQVFIVCVAYSSGSFSFGQGSIDFESIPGGMPSDGLVISTQFMSSHGVSFSLENGLFPVLAQVGAPLTAFQGPGGAADTPRAGVNLGQFFLTDDGMLNGIPSPLIATYSSPVAAASGDIIDIDFSEAWTAQAIGANGFILEETQLTAPPGADGSRSSWAFIRGQADIFAIRIVFTGSPVGGGNVGLAFDNFSTSSVGSNVGQPNTTLASLRINSIGSGGGSGPFPVSVSGSGTLTLDWQGPPLAALALFTGPINIGSISGPCFGSVDIGTPPYYYDLLLVFDGTAPGQGLFFSTDVSGVAQQTITLPSLSSGLVFGLQGLVYQGSAANCAAITTAAFEVAVN